MRPITFPKIFRRTPVANSLPVAPKPSYDPAVSNPPAIGGDAILGVSGNAAPASVPASRRVIDHDAGGYGRQYRGIVDDLNDGPVPDYINRATPAANAGVIGDGMTGWPYDGNAYYMPRAGIPRTPQTVTPYRKTIDSGVTIPSVGIGAPLS